MKLIFDQNIICIITIKLYFILSIVSLHLINLWHHLKKFYLQIWYFNSLHRKNGKKHLLSKLQYLYFVLPVFNTQSLFSSMFMKKTKSTITISNPKIARQMTARLILYVKMSPTLMKVQLMTWVDNSWVSQMSTAKVVWLLLTISNVSKVISGNFDTE